MGHRDSIGLNIYILTCNCFPSANLTILIPSTGPLVSECLALEAAAESRKTTNKTYGDEGDLMMHSMPIKVDKDGCTSKSRLLTPTNRNRVGCCRFCGRLNRYVRSCIYNRATNAGVWGRLPSSRLLVWIPYIIYVKRQALLYLGLRSEGLLDLLTWISPRSIQIWAHSLL